MEPFKNLLGLPAASRISKAVKRAHPSFHDTAFLKNLKAELEPLELKQRMMLLTERLERCLPEDPRESFRILEDSLKMSETDAIGLSGFPVWPLTHFVAQNGQRHFELSMRALSAMTKVFSAEFAIRPFLINDEIRSLRQLQKWTEHENEHLRRLASEGSRPLLPWGIKLTEFVKSPEKTWPILAALRDDESKYVQKSVANHLNDHSKNHGDWLIKRLGTWRKDSTLRPTGEWIIRHATRTLVKKGHPGALLLHGVKPLTLNRVKTELLTKKVKLNTSLEVRVHLQNSTPEDVNLIVDIEISFLKANGKHSPKVFKGKKLILAAGAKGRILLKVPLRKVTTRRYYAGKQKGSVLINGARQKEFSFELLT